MRKFFLFLLFIAMLPLFADKSSGNKKLGNSFYNSYENSYKNSYSSSYKSAYKNSYHNLYDPNYGKYLKFVIENDAIAEENFVKYFSDWQWSGQEQDFFSYAESRAEQEKQLELCYNKALAKFGVGTAIVATTWIVSFAVPGGQIFTLSMIVVAKATTVGALSGGAMGAVTSAGFAFAYLQGKRGDELFYDTINGATDGYLVGAITGLISGGAKAYKLAKEANALKDISGVETIFDGKVYDSSGKFLGDFKGEYPKGTINMGKVGTTVNGVPYEWQLVNDAEGNFYKAVMPKFEGVKIKFPDELQFAGRKVHNDYVWKVLNSPELCAKNGISEKQAKYILEHYDDFTVHHLGERNTIQLVDSEIHSSARHTGGYSMWGK